MRLRSIFRRSPHIHPSSGVGSGAPTSSSSATATVLNEPFSSVDGETAGLKSTLSVAGEVTAAEGSNGDGGLCDSVPPSPGVLTVIEKKPSSRLAAGH